jgi:hypothetical protein
MDRRSGLISFFCVGKTKRSLTNAAEQLIRVDEPENANILGVIPSPLQPTFYAYIVLDNLNGTRFVVDCRD